MPTPRQNEQIRKDIERKETEAVAKENTARKDYTSLEKTDEIALYYGFTPVVAPRVDKPDPALAKMLKEIELDHKDHSQKNEVFNLCLEEECVLLANYERQELWKQPQPIMISYESAGVRKKKPRERHFNVHVIGAHKSIAEATILKTIAVILTEEGYKDLSIEINSLGDKDSIAKFNRELVAYYRKHLSSLPAECKQTLKHDPLELLSCTHEKCKELAASAPKSLSYLTEKGRTHFKEVLEYLESMGIPYNINPALVGKRFAAETVFEVRDGEKMVALGMRYDALSKRIGLKKEVPAVGAQLVFESKDREKIKKGSPVTKRPKFYFIQLGFDAKLKSLRVIEILRQAKVPLYQSLSKDKLAGQMSVAENLRIPYTIIMGQKEAMEDSVIVRDMPTRSQETVRIDDLAKYIEKLK